MVKRSCYIDIVAVPKLLAVLSWGAHKYLVGHKDRLRTVRQVWKLCAGSMFRGCQHWETVIPRFLMVRYQPVKGYHEFPCHV